MFIETSDLPTPIAQVARRLNTIGPDGSGDTFLLASNLFEISLKLIAVTFYAGLRGTSKEHAYRLAYEMIRGDSMGTWETAIHKATSQPATGFYSPDFYPLVAWATQSRGGGREEWFDEAAASLKTIGDLLGIDVGIPERKPRCLHLLNAFVQLRNKTKAHGAVGPAFFGKANRQYIKALKHLISNAPAFTWSWWYMEQKPDGERRGVLLRGDSPRAQSSDVQRVTVKQPGLHVWPEGALHPYPCSRLVLADSECREFLFPNGGYSDAGKAEFIDYYRGTTCRLGVPHFRRAPAPLPKSETHGQTSLDVHANVFGNLPQVPRHYVRREALEKELLLRLRDRNHHIVTLHGRGGIGKTSLALRVVHDLSAEHPTWFDAIVWFSARDLDLLHTGPRNVDPAVITLGDVSRLYGSLFSLDESIEQFAEELRTKKEPDEKGRLFVFDNFETMESAKDVHAFLDTHTHLPNKVLITTRERSFKADFPIEVRGMTRSESDELVLELARELAIAGIVDGDVLESLFEYSEGHPYVLRVLVGEIAKEGRYVPPRTLLPQRMDIIEAVFERSFRRLSTAGRRVFLLVANWRSAVAELALLVTLGRRGIDVEEGIEECRRLSLIEGHELSDQQYAYSAPQLARVFGKKKLEGDPDRLVIQEDLEILQRFGVVPANRPVQAVAEEYVEGFLRWAMGEVREGAAEEGEEDQLDVLESILESLAELWPRAWRWLADFRMAREAETEAIQYSLRRAVEEMPTEPEVWQRRADYARSVGDEATWISSEIRAAELRPKDAGYLKRVAQDLNTYIAEHTAEIPTVRRGVYLASVRELMEQVADELDATGLSRLAWLFLHENNQEKGYKYAAKGLEKDPHNEHCYRIVERARAEGWSSGD